SGDDARPQNVPDLIFGDASRADVGQAGLNADENSHDIHQAVPANRERSKLNQDRTEINDDGSYHAVDTCSENCAVMIHGFWVEVEWARQPSVVPIPTNAMPKKPCGPLGISLRQAQKAKTPATLRWLISKENAGLGIEQLPQPFPTSRRCSL